MSYLERPLADLLHDTATRTPTPGGGAIVAVTAALAAATAHMAAAFSADKKRFAAHRDQIADAMEQLQRGQQLLTGLMEEDMAAFSAWQSARKSGKPAEKAAALAAAVAVPESIAATCCSLLKTVGRLVPITTEHLHSDLAIAALLAEACVRGAHCNVHINLQDAQESDRHEILQTLKQREESAAQSLQNLLATIESTESPHQASQQEGTG